MNIGRASTIIVRTGNSYRQTTMGSGREDSDRLTVEDIRHCACHQWVSGGRRVVFHRIEGDEPCAVSLDIETGKEEILAEGMQVGWTQPQSDLVPLYPAHWSPRKGLELVIVDVLTGKKETVLTAEMVREAYPEYFEGEFGDARVSVFFPVLSPELNRVSFKMSTPAGGHYRTPKASSRKGLFCYDLHKRRLLYMQSYYGHPCWWMTSSTLLWSSAHPGELFFIDIERGSKKKVAESLPPFPGSHLTSGADRRLLCLDTQLMNFGGGGAWVVVVAEVGTGAYTFVHRFEDSRGARSWRPAHPHSVFSLNGRRLYFNLNSHRYTRLYLAHPEV